MTDKPDPPLPRTGGSYIFDEATGTYLPAPLATAPEAPAIDEPAPVVAEPEPIAKKDTRK